MTGAASGIGLGIARALGAAGAKVALADIDGTRLARVLRELTDSGVEACAVDLDVTDAGQWAAAADKAEEALGPISILVNNAGVSGGGAIDETSLEVWRWVYRVNVEAQFIGVSTFFPRFRSRGRRAHILNTASMVGMVPMARASAYCSSKYASIGFSMVLREELAATEIGVSVLCPGTVATRIVTTAAEGEAALLGQTVNSAVVEKNSDLVARGAEPDLVGEQVLEAIQQGQFLIITHGDWEPLVTKVQTEFVGVFSDFDNRYGPDVTVPFLLGGSSPVIT